MSKQPLPRRATNRLPLLHGVLLAAAAAVALTGCGDETAATESAPDAADKDTRRIINVEVMPLQRESFRDVIRLTGTVVADREVTVSTEEGGTVTQVLVDKGSPVRRGEPLLRLDVDLLAAQRDDARSQSQLAEDLWQRARPLYEEDGIGTESEYLQARYAAESAAARLALIEERLQRMVIRAPFDGVFDVRFVEVGSVVAPGQAVGHLVDLTPLKVTAGVPERYAADVEVGATAGVRFPDLGQQGRATVTYVGATVHPGNRTFAVELALETPVAGAKPQMVADVELERRSLAGVITVPRQALVRTEAGFSAFVVDGQGDGATAAARPVTLGPSAKDVVVVASGLSPGDRLVVVGQNQVADGDRVRIVSPR